MQKLHFPEFEFRISEAQQKKLIFDIVRKKFIPLTPEEWVRQHVIHYFQTHKKVALHLMAVERELRFNNLSKRFDMLVFNSNAKPVCIIECKAPDVKINLNTVIQIGTYNRSFQCPWLYLTNGLQHFWFTIEEGKLTPASEPLLFE